jgi:hypothetical protein
MYYHFYSRFAPSLALDKGEKSGQPVPANLQVYIRIKMVLLEKIALLNRIFYRCGHDFSWNPIITSLNRASEPLLCPEYLRSQISGSTFILAGVW